MKHAQVGKVALLSTRHPKRDSERKRIVFGVYKIEDVNQGNSGEIWIKGSTDHAIRLSESAAVALPYWKFKRMKAGVAAAWGSGLFRICRIRR